MFSEIQNGLKQYKQQQISFNWWIPLKLAILDLPLRVFIHQVSISDIIADILARLVGLHQISQFFLVCIQIINMIRFMISKICTYQLSSIHLDFGFGVVSAAPGPPWTAKWCLRQHCVPLASQSPAPWRRFWLNILHPLLDSIDFIGLDGYLIAWGNISI